MKDRHDVPYIVIERQSGGFMAFLGGALIGAAIALLYAPRSGRETRKELREGARRVREAAEDTLRQVQERVSVAVEDVRRQVHERMDDARDAIEAGRAAARRTRSELEARIRSAAAEFHAAAGDVLSGPEEPGRASASKDSPSAD